MKETKKEMMEMDLNLIEMDDDLNIEELAVDVTSTEDIISLNKMLGLDTTELELDILEQKRSDF